MTELRRFDLDGGGSVVVEVDGRAGVTPAGNAGKVVREARATFDRALSEVRDAASAALGQFQSMAHRPDEVEISFGVQLTAEAGAVIARTGVQGQLTVTVRWQRPPHGPTPPHPEAPVSPQ
ncbi:CU044_2847 family protein [Micromonospora sp. NPDC005203]|uniref:CU044_2847 family protein n=1 Tax=Micromonospora sp. NPDC005203 TaxID=3364226 RepID=UPI00369FAFF2